MAVADQVSPDGGGRGGGGRGGGHRGHGTGLGLEGQARSQKGDQEFWGLGVRAHAPEGESGKATGQVRYGHKTDEKADGFVGEVRCLSKDSAGVIQLSGTIQRSGSRQARQKDGGDKPDQKGADPSTGSTDPAAFLDQLTNPGGTGEAPTPNGDGDGDGRGREGGQRGELDGKDFAFTIDVPGSPQRFSAPKLGDAGTLSACSAGESGGQPVTRGGFRSTETQGR
jgi:hypothetical protein